MICVRLCVLKQPSHTAGCLCCNCLPLVLTCNMCLVNGWELAPRLRKDRCYQAMPRSQSELLHHIGSPLYEHACCAVNFCMRFCNYKSNFFINLLISPSSKFYSNIFFMYFSKILPNLKLVYRTIKHENTAHLKK